MTSTVAPRLATTSIAPKIRQAPNENRKVVRDGLIVTLGGQFQRALGTLTALALRWGLDPARLGVYTGLRIYLDQTNRTSLGVGLGAVQEIPILRAAGCFDEARRVAEVANAANTLTSAAYALVLVMVAALWALSPTAGPLATEWVGGLVAMAALALLHRRLSFHIAVLRAHREFTVTTELEVLEGFASAPLVILGLWLGGFWGLLAAVGLLLVIKLVYLHARHPLRIGLEWDLPATLRLMRIGLPIFLSTATFGVLMSLDRILILWRLPDSEQALGLYSIALLGTNWTLDAAGRVGMVLYPHFQTTLGRTGDPKVVAHDASRAAEVQAPLLALGAAMAYLIAPAFLGTLMPRYLDGLPALRPLLPGMLLLALSWPARQALVTVGRPYRLSALAGIGIGVAIGVGVCGASTAGITGVAWGMTAGYAAVFVLTSAAMFGTTLGVSCWTAHLARMFALSAWPMVGAVLIDTVLEIFGNHWLHLAGQGVLLVFWALPVLLVWAHRQGWGGLLRRGKRAETKQSQPWLTPADPGRRGRRRQRGEVAAR